MRRAFEAQARGDFAAATREVERLDDRRLIGHLVADRLRRQGEQAAVPEFQSWLADFSDHPDAPLLHEMLVARLPRGAAVPPPPLLAEWPNPLQDTLPEEQAAGPVQNRNPSLDRAVQQRAAEGNLDAMSALIARTRGMTPAYAGQLKAEAAQALFRQGQDERSLRLAQEALRLAPDNATAAFQAGLSAWALERYEGAMAAFERAARNEAAAPAMRAAAAYWTARAA
ncbi:MAG: lytic transglycosylase domain-containing protein, partial [Acetobacteraceae bacterium]|nr:lytic transglycosylase domain-containing protein [Acetobacteraceae bacterium]